MFVKTYRGKSPEECFKKMRAQMGRDAVILQSRSFRRLFGTCHEVVAASDVSIAIDKIASARASQSREEEPARAIYGYAGANGNKKAMEAERLGGARGGMATVPGEAVDPRIGELEKQIAALKASLTALSTPAAGVNGREKAPAPTSYDFLLEKLLDAEVAEPLAKRLIEEIPEGVSEAAAASELRSQIARRFKIAGKLMPVPGRTRIVAFMGGTGVGKTTTIAKIAAQLSLADRLSVGIITMDTHRVAAVQQLQTYGEILRVPVKVAYNRGEFTQHLAEFQKEKRHFVLVDTAGRSPHDTLPLAEAAGSLDGLEDVTRLLTLPATLSARDFENMVTRFQSVFTPDAMIMTKVDEATDNAYVGHLLSVQVKTGLPVAYLTSGQRVPDDMLAPDAHALTARLLTTAVL